jgi:hypothetical protein
MTTQMFDVKQNVIQKVDTQQLYGLPVDTTVAFSNHKGIYKSGIERRQRKLLKKLDFLPPFLAPNERILRVTFGYSPASFVEQLLTGALLHPLKRALFVITNKRILHIPTTHHLSYRYSISQIMYTDCRQIRFRGSTLIVKYKSGRTEKFRCIRRRGRKKVKAILKGMSLEGRASQSLERTHLCPRCIKPLIKGYYTCPTCSLKFKSKARATLLSIIFPGGGYFYTRHPFLGVLEAAMESLFVFLLVAASTIFLKVSSDNPKGLSQAIVMCATILVYEKLATTLFSNKCVDEFIPKQRRVAVQPDKESPDHVTPNLEEALTTGWRSI